MMGTLVVKRLIHLYIRVGILKSGNFVLDNTVEMFHFKEFVNLNVYWFPNKTYV